LVHHLGDGLHIHRREHLVHSLDDGPHRLGHLLHLDGALKARGNGVDARGESQVILRVVLVADGILRVDARPIVVVLFEGSLDLVLFLLRARVKRQTRMAMTSLLLGT